MNASANSKSYEPGAQQNMQVHNSHQTIQVRSGIMLICKHGDAAREALYREFKQMIDKQVNTALHKTDLTPAQKQQALQSVNLIKKK